MVSLAPHDDIDRIMAVMQEAFDPAYGEAWTRAQLDNTLVLGHCSYAMITSDGQVPEEMAPAAGFTLTRTILDEEELLLFAVSPAWRGRGLGKTLLQQLIETAPARGVKRIFLEMRDNNPAESLYRNCGFRPVGRRPQYYRTREGQRIDAITFALDMN